MKLVFLLSYLLILAYPTSALATVYPIVKGLDKTEVRTGGRLGIIGENFTQSGTKKCMKNVQNAMSTEQVDCSYVLEIVLARRIGNSVTNNIAPVVAFSPNLVTVSIPNVPSGEYMIYYNHYSPETKQYSMMQRKELTVKIINVPKPTPTLTPTPTSTPEPTPTLTSTPAPTPTLQPQRSFMQSVTTSIFSFFKQIFHF